MSISSSSDRQYGVVFTPKTLADFIVKRFGIYERWLEGASVCDPTAGDGAFINALVHEALRNRVSLTRELLSRLFYVERNDLFARAFVNRFRTGYKIEFPEGNIFVCDVVTETPDLRVDILLGNPPWVNFADLDDQYKQKLKPFFFSSGLVLMPQALLLGSSRMDVAALVIAQSINALLSDHGHAVFLVPLSVFLNEGAHAGFRHYRLPRGKSYAVREIYDFADHALFEGANTRFGIALFERDEKPSYPIPYHVLEGSDWKRNYAKPFPNAFSALSVHASPDGLASLGSHGRIVLREDQKPRQGINTCGANKIFVFEERPEFLPHDLVYPLLTKDCFQGGDLVSEPTRFIFVPHDHSIGKPLDHRTLADHFPSAWSYLQEHRQDLSQRKGSLIGSWIKRGFWWACLGVGPYSFSPFKVVWEALGRSEFQPIIAGDADGSQWQGNQALHAYVPCRDREEAEAVRCQLQQPFVEQYLLSCRMGGTRNWAQPGRLKNLVKFVSMQPSLFD